MPFSILTIIYEFDKTIIIDRKYLYGKVYMKSKVKFLIFLPMVAMFFIEAFLWNSVNVEKIVADDILCEPGSYRIQDGCTSCLKKDGNYCPDGKSFYCCPNGTEPANSHAKSKDDCVPCQAGYKSKSGYGKAGCSTCQPIEYCWRRGTSRGNEYTVSTTMPGTNWIQVGDNDKVTCGGTVSCYKNNNNYFWGDYKGIDGYTEVANVSSENDCHEPDKYCWVKKAANGNEYQISKDSLGSEWTNVGKEGSVTCSEIDRCYVNKGKLLWGKYSGRNDYSLKEAIMSKEECQEENNNVKSNKSLILILIIVISLILIGICLYLYHILDKREKNNY